MNMTKTIFVLAFSVLFCSSCGYPAFHRTSAESLLPNPAIPREWHAVMHDRLQACTDKLDDARHGAWEAKKSTYEAAAVGSTVAMVFGGAAGALGVAAQRTLSSIAGSVAVGFGIYQAASVDRKQMEDETHKEFIMIATWNSLKIRMKDFENILAEQDGADAAPENVAVRNRAFRNLNYALSACALEPLIAADFVIKADTESAEQMKQRSLLKGLE